MERFDLVAGYTAGVVGHVTALHAQYYAENWGFGKYFEIKIATGLTEFIAEYDEHCDCVFSILVDGKIEGSISVDGSNDPQNVAHIRWFIMSDKLRGQGIGRYLLEQAMRFCEEKDYSHVYLWTFKGLDNAKHLYEKFGFRLTEEKEGDRWGTSVIEQRYDMKPAKTK